MRKNPWFWAVVWLIVCVLPFAAIPPLLNEGLLPMGISLAVMMLVIYAACPVLALVAGYFAARRGVPAAVAWLFAPVPYWVLLPLWMYEPDWKILLVSCVVGVVSGTAGELMRKRKQKRGSR